ncbi:hypothetical protein POVCU2_0005940 [Plasmodium ovale curtisi]|uniref:Uncharacterized protein n=1 Tax=Plasmodium ovale curtisi TaxID=864141 RepID=A0A1A8VRA4_PLAOA|nr:hypothetical protein POVCU2_0005940 [Plasmodium ovale curtisi]SBS81337.1 hypothetical protein POVCU1_005320 [Plasmodium ovale curtisi]
MGEKGGTCSKKDILYINIYILCGESRVPLTGGELQAELHIHTTNASLYMKKYIDPDEVKTKQGKRAKREIKR